MTAEAAPEREIRRIQISPLPTGDSLEAETPIICHSPTFSFADLIPHSRSISSPEPTGSPPPAGRIGAYYVEGGRPVKAEVKLLVKTADVGREAIEIRSIREFVDLPSAGGPFSRIFQSSSRPESPSGRTTAVTPRNSSPIRCLSPGPSSAGAAAAGRPESPTASPNAHDLRNAKLLVRSLSPVPSPPSARSASPLGKDEPVCQVCPSGGACSSPL